MLQPKTTPAADPTLEDGEINQVPVTEELAKAVDSWSMGDEPPAGSMSSLIQDKYPHLKPIGDDEDEGEGAPASSQADESGLSEEGREGDGQEGEGADEGAGDDEGAGEEAPPMDLAQFREAIPDRAIESVDDVIDEIQTLRGFRQDLEDMAEVVSGNPELAQYLEAIIVKGVDPHAAAIDAFGELTAEPDKLEDPDKWADWKTAKDARMSLIDGRKQKAQAAEKAKKAFNKQMGEAFMVTVREMGIEKADARALQDTFLSIISGEPNSGNFRKDAFRLLYLGLHHDRLVSEAVSEAKKEGANNALESVATRRNAGRGGRLPQRPTGTGGVKPQQRKPTQEQDLVALAEKFSRLGEINTDWP